MTIRELKMPNDLLPLADMLVETFQYPENPAWSVQADDEEDISREIRTLKRVWPLIRMAQTISKPLRDLFRGFVWEEDGKIGGVVIAQRRGSSHTWTVGTVGVLPEFRRRGLARKLLTRTLDDIRQRGGTHINLSVIDQNVPAYSLYRSLGFEHYSSETEYDLIPQGRVATPALMGGYELSRLDRFDWEKRYTLAKRITPDNIRPYTPVEVGRFKQPAAGRIIAPALDKMQKRVEKRFVFYSAGVLVAHSGFRTRPSLTGTSSIWAQLDPAHPALAAYLLAAALDAVVELSPTLRVQLSVPGWMPALAQSAEDLGFKKRLAYHELGLIL
ncbi:GNAT family N-acetyltransferase [Candidatus Bipolaricaulota bacterium]|nr:GNAT family N-acetyltransferase [Candidatus Bipolaricaulota bacterium]